MSFGSVATCSSALCSAMRLVVTVVLQLLLLNSVRADGKGEVVFLRYKDTGCGGNDMCDFYFKNVKIAIGNGPAVTFYDYYVADEWEGDSIPNTEDVDLSARFPNPVEIELKTNGTVAILMNVWDSDDGFTGGDDLVRQIKGTDCLVDFSTISTMDEWKNYKFYFNSTDKAHYLEIKYRITECGGYFALPGCDFCAATYYTADCSVNCVPTDHRHACNAQGQLVCGDLYQGDQCAECKGRNREGDECRCKEGWKGTNCDSCIDGHYGTDCSDICFPEPNAYNCSDTGKKICFDGHYGVNCSDTCFPKPNVYNCSDTGKKICLDGHYGVNCSDICFPEPDAYNCSATGKKICLDGHYGVNCSDICFPKPNAYNCSATGKKICFDGHYGVNCTDICFPKPDVYNCSAAGEKICLDMGLSAENDCEVTTSVHERKTLALLATILVLVTILNVLCVLLIVVICRHDVQRS